MKIVKIYELLVCKTFGLKIWSCKFFDKFQVCYQLNLFPLQLSTKPLTRMWSWWARAPMEVSTMCGRATMLMLFSLVYGSYSYSEFKGFFQNLSLGIWIVGKEKREADCNSIFVRPASIQGKNIEKEPFSWKQKYFILDPQNYNTLRILFLAFTLPN